MQPELSLVDNLRFGLVHVRLDSDAFIKQFGLVFNNRLRREVWVFLQLSTIRSDMGQHLQFLQCFNAYDDVFFSELFFAGGGG